MGGYWRIFRRIGAVSAITAGWALLVALLAVSTSVLGARAHDPADPAPAGPWISQSSGVLLAYAAPREDPPAPCLPTRHVARSPELPLPLPDAEAEAIRSPQQFAFRCADSRSPPLI